MNSVCFVTVSVGMHEVCLSSGNERYGGRAHVCGVVAQSVQRAGHVPLEVNL